jgi:hypothetical protein
LLFVGGFIAWRSGFLVQALLKRWDPTAFMAPNIRSIQFGHVIPTREELASNGDMQTVLTGTTSTFDLLALTGYQTLETYKQQLLSAAKRGVHVRIMLVDPIENDGASIRENCRAMGCDPVQTLAEAQHTAALVKEMADTIESARNNPKYGFSQDRSAVGVRGITLQFLGSRLR